MRKPVALVTLILTAFAPIFPPVAEAALTYRQGEGWSRDGENAGPAEASPSAQLKQAQDFEAAGDYKKAMASYRNLVKTWPTSGAAPKAQIKIADLYLASGQSEAAYKAYGKYISDHPEGEEFEAAVEGQFRVANGFLDGERRRVFGVKTFSSMTRAQEMFEEIVKNAPFSKFAPMSQFNIGRSLEKQGKLDEAVEAYRVAAEKYPGDEVAADAQYQIGYILHQSAQKGSNDDAARMKAREAFEDFLLRHPNSEKVSQANENLQSLASEDVRKVLDIGRFYERTGNYKAAVIYYEEVLSFGVEGEESQIARKQIEHLRATVGEEALRAGPEHTETGEKAKERRKLQAQVDTASRPDFAGPPAPRVPDEVAPATPQLRAPRGAVEPTLPSGSGVNAPAEPESLIPPSEGAL